MQTSTGASTQTRERARDRARETACGRDQDNQTSQLQLRSSLALRDPSTHLTARQAIYACKVET
eukprot:6193376-Pleurochrysis_carterae.AAC.2